MEDWFNGVLKLHKSVFIIPIIHYSSTPVLNTYLTLTRPDLDKGTEMEKYTQEGLALVMLLVSCFTCMITTPIYGDGKLLRGERWKKFSIQDTQADFYVAPDGNDSWSGTLAEPNSDKSDGPYATIERAQKAVRLLKKEVYTDKKEPIEKRWIGSPHKFGEGRDILVLIRGGYYSLEQPLHFAPEDGGERCETDLPSGAFEYHKLKDYYVTYAAYPGEIPIISGGRKITSWSKERGKWVTFVEGVEIKKLIVNGKTQTLARTPNEGYFTPPEMPESIREFKFRKGELKQWPNMKDNRIIMLLRWHRGVNAITEIDEKHQVARLQKPQQGIIVVPPRYYIENVEALLDAPGEWFFDKMTRKLSYLPADDIGEPDKTIVVAPILSQLILVKGKTEKPVRNLRFYGLTFEATNPGEQAISFEYAHSCELVDNEIRSIGGIAVYLAKGCYQNRILSNSISGADEGGIIIAGNPHPENWMDIIRENRFSYNYLADCGGTTIRANNTLHTIVSHNEITNTRGRTAISLGGWANLEEAIDGGYRVEYNHLHHVQKDADDSGAITTAGLTHDSVVRGNLIHDVKAGYFNDNVAIWFDNMSSGWLAEDNIFYNLEQAEMKLCASNLVDNIYHDNHLIETPENAPEGIIDGDPEFEFSQLRIDDTHGNGQKIFNTGEFVKVSAAVRNTGATGIKPVDLYIDGKVAESKKFPVIHHNTRRIRFDVRFYEPGVHQIAIGTTPYKAIKIAGTPLSVIVDEFKLSKSILPVGEKTIASAIVKNLKDRENHADVKLYMNGNAVETKSIHLSPLGSEKVTFQLEPAQGIHQIGIGNAPARILEVYPHQSIDITTSDLRQYCSGTARPCQFKIDKTKNRFRIEASGTDFLHAEDSYAAIYLKGAIQGNFVATVKVNRFGEKTHEWFRAGLFVRNDITKSFEVEPGSAGSVLVFVTPGRFGIQWDEHGDGCMHKAMSQNHPKTEPYPMWIKLERHGDSFSGYLSYDGENWTGTYHTLPVPGLAEIIDIGLVVGSCDQRVYWAEFEDFKLEIEKVGWK